MTTAVSYTDLQGEVAVALGWQRDPDDWGTTRSSDFDRINKRALNQVYYPPILPGEHRQHQWSFLYPLATLELTPSYETGTIAIASGVVTLTGGTFPSWAAQGDLWVADSNDVTHRYTVNTRDGDTQVTLDDTSVTISAGASYSLHRHYYDLPDDFGGMESDDFTYRRDEASGLYKLTRTSDRELRSLDWDEQTNATPNLYALVPVPPTSSKSSRWRVAFGPGLASQTKFVEYRYRAIPPELDGVTDVYPYGAAEHGRTFIASYIDIAYQMIRYSEEKHVAFLECLAGSIMRDRQMNASHRLREDRECYWHPKELLDARRRHIPPTSYTLFN